MVKTKCCAIGSLMMLLCFCSFGFSYDPTIKVPADRVYKNDIVEIGKKLVLDEKLSYGSAECVSVDGSGIWVKFSAHNVTKNNDFDCYVLNEGDAVSQISRGVSRFIMNEYKNANDMSCTVGANIKNLAKWTAKVDNSQTSAKPSPEILRAFERDIDAIHRYYLFYEEGKKYQPLRFPINIHKEKEKQFQEKYKDLIKDPCNHFKEKEGKILEGIRDFFQRKKR